ncbi:MAG: type II toxin-antitoxin system RelE/ParE family toxin [Chitinophagaceae bacterium]|jgi:plasmid stabilization system protein ParE|nr:type II toxin-antitoxin system RelE/ParE family toxin [Chitinophagaceae bacterium]
MSYKIIYLPTVVAEREKIIAWYEERSYKATNNFIAEFQETINKISLNPLLYRNTHKEYREVKMTKYPYYIIYRVNETDKEVAILRVYHTARSPLKKYSDL